MKLSGVPCSISRLSRPHLLLSNLHRWWNRARRRVSDYAHAREPIPKHADAHPTPADLEEEEENVSSIDDIINVFHREVNLQAFQVARLNLTQRYIDILQSEEKLLNDLLPQVQQGSAIDRNIQNHLLLLSNKLAVLERCRIEELAEGTPSEVSEGEESPRSEQELETTKEQNQVAPGFSLETIPDLIHGRSFVVSQAKLHDKTVRGMMLVNKSRLLTHMLSWSRDLVLSNIDFGARVMKRSSWLSDRFVISASVLRGTDVLMTMLWDSGQNRCVLASWSLQTSYEQEMHKCDESWRPRATIEFEKGVLLSMKVVNSSSHIICFGSSSSDGGLVLYLFKLRKGFKPKLIVHEEFGARNADCRSKWPEQHLAFYTIPSDFIISENSRNLALSWSRTGALVVWNLAKGFEMERIAMTSLNKGLRVPTNGARLIAGDRLIATWKHGVHIWNLVLGGTIEHAVVLGGQFDVVGVNFLYAESSLMPSHVLMWLDASQPHGLSLVVWKMPLFEFSGGRLYFKGKDVLGRLEASFRGHTGAIRGIRLIRKQEENEFSCTALTWSAGPKLLLWDLDKRGERIQPEHEFLGHLGGIDRVQMFSGKRVPGTRWTQLALSYSKLDEKLIVWNITLRSMIGSFTFMYPLSVLPSNTFENVRPDDLVDANSSFPSIAIGFDNGEASILKAPSTIE